MTPEHALSEGWSVGGVKYGLDWFARAMISASVLVGIEVVPHARAVDSTTLPASAALHEIVVDRGFSSEAFTADRTRGQLSSSEKRRRQAPLGDGALDGA